MTSVIEKEKQSGPLLSVTGRMTLSSPANSLDPVAPIRLDLASLQCTQEDVSIGELVAPIVLKSLRPSLIGEILVSVGGSRRGATVPVTVDLFAPLGVAGVPGLAEVVDMCVSREIIDPPKVATLCMQQRPVPVGKLRRLVLHSALVASNDLSCLSDGLGGSVDPLIVKNVMSHLALRDICSMSRVCKEWLHAIDSHVEFWKPLIWWSELSYASNAQLEAPLGAGNLAAWVHLIVNYAQFSGRQKVLAVLSMPHSCGGCGAALHGRQLSRASKVAAAVASIETLNHLQSLCSACGDAFIVTMQTMDRTFPSISRFDLVELPSFKFDNRKSFLWGHLMGLENQVRRAALEIKANEAGISIREMWEKLHPCSEAERRRLYQEETQGPDLDRILGMDVEEEESDGGNRDAERKSDVAVITGPIYWFPLSVVRPEESEVVVTDEERLMRRNLELLVQLGLAAQVKESTTEVGFAETFDTPVPDMEAEAGGSSKRDSKRRKAEDEELEFKMDSSSGNEDSEDSLGDSSADQPKKRGRPRSQDLEDDVEEFEGMPVSLQTLESDPDLLNFLSRFDLKDKVRDGRHAKFKLCKALWDSTVDPTASEGDALLAFKAGDELVVAFWLEKRSWSICYRLSDPYDYEKNCRKYGWVPNNFVKVVESWKGKASGIGKGWNS